MLPRYPRQNTKSMKPLCAYNFIMCHRIGRPPISTMGLGRYSVSSRKRVPSPPHSITTFTRFSWQVLVLVSRVKVRADCAKTNLPGVQRNCQSYSSPRLGRWQFRFHSITTITGNVSLMDSGFGSGLSAYSRRVFPLLPLVVSRQASCRKFLPILRLASMLDWYSDCHSPPGTRHAFHPSRTSSAVPCKVGKSEWGARF